MNVRYSLPAAFALAVILAGCNPAPPPPAPDTHDADVKAIQDVETAWSQAFATKDVDKITAFYSNDATVLGAGMPTVNGVAAIKTAFGPMLADKNFSLSFAATSTDVAKSGDLGYSNGTYTQTTTDAKTKKAVTENGKFLTVFKKQADGGWKAVEDSFSSDGPPAPAKKG